MAFAVKKRSVGAAEKKWTGEITECVKKRLVGDSLEAELLDAVNRGFTVVEKLG
jgi:hypothetical protein